MERANDLFKKPKSRTIKHFICEGCGREVEQQELVIPSGPYKDQTTIANYGCKCEDLEIAKKALENRERAKRQKLKEKFDYYSLINKSLETATLKNYNPTNSELFEAKQRIMTYIQDFDGQRNLLLHGNYGTGKSHLSVSVTKELMAKGYTCLFVSLPKLFTKIKETYNNIGVTEDELLQMIQDVDLLVLDDIGAEQQTEWANTKLFEILDDRSGKATIYTTNLSSQELRGHINERNVSRMMENTEVIKMTGKDYRRKEF